MKKIARRSFLKTSTLAGTGWLAMPLLQKINYTPLNELYALCEALVATWGKALLQLQVKDKASPNYGGLLSPDNNQVPGRCGDAIYPFFYLGHKTGDHRWIDAALLLYAWMEKTVSQPDGSWLNEPVKGSWKGITVFTATALGETLKLYGSSMPPDFKSALEQRLKKAGTYIRDNFSVDYGNINYPIAATYCLSLLGQLLDDQSFKQKAVALGEQALNFITPKDGFIFGEGTPYYKKTAKGCLPVDLGYNVEESLPSLVLYAKLNDDARVLTAVTRSLHTHLEFMLPDGAWDNSWGTRNFKWTYWGSRTSDGCQPAYALMADADPVFYSAALANTKLLQSCTHEGILYGGPHVAAHGLKPGIHHTFCHIKALVTTLTHGAPMRQHQFEPGPLPREKASGVRVFSDIQTWLLAKAGFRATVTGYDREYKETTQGHPTGGALSLLWHEKTGPLMAASMNAYQLFEAGNMAVDSDPLSMPLTPRMELKTDTAVYMNIADLSAVITDKSNKEEIVISTLAKLVDKNQQSPGTGDIHCEVSYTLSAQKAVLRFSYSGNPPEKNIRVVLPIISKSGEQVHVIAANKLEIKKDNATVLISANHPLLQLPTNHGRIFNFVPGLEAIPLAIEHNEAIIEIEVIS